MSSAVKVNQQAEMKKTHDLADGEKEEKDQLDELLSRLPKLASLFDVSQKIGEGTFSSVYLGTLKCHSHLEESDRKKFAIKYLVPTSHPRRVERELRCLQDIGGQDNIIGVELCLRNLDTIVFVMPYIPHRKFSEYVLDMDINETRNYIKALLIALKRVHQFGIIHRDVKPSNFLYDRNTQRYYLADFGLAQTVSSLSRNKFKVCDSSNNNISVAPNDEVKRKHSGESEPQSPAKKFASGTVAPCVSFKKIQTDYHKQPSGSQTNKDVTIRCQCFGMPMVCDCCLMRPSMKASRAGTQGFRPPEVLLKYPHQSTAVDIWACGVILLCILSGKYPFFKASDDASALAEFISLFGTNRIRIIAALLGRHIMCSHEMRGLDLRKLCVRLHRNMLAIRNQTKPTTIKITSKCINCHISIDECICFDEQQHKKKQWSGYPDSAFDLLEKLLDLNPHTRITAADALNHPFLKGE